MEPGGMFLEMANLSNKSISEESSVAESPMKVLLPPGVSGGVYGNLNSLIINSNSEDSSPWEESAVDSALLAISAPQHKQHIHSHLHVHL